MEKHRVAKKAGSMRGSISGDGHQREEEVIPSSAERVPAHTAPDINEKIRRRTEQDIAYFGSAGKEAIEQRLRELDREWDVERLLEANASSVMLLGLGLATFFDRKWMVLPAIVGGFLLQHAIQGWCPPMELFRRMGVRTSQEIEQERYALKVIRGDFKDVGEQSTVTQSDVNRLLERVEA
jgi:hypothetical protein